MISNPKRRTNALSPKDEWFNYYAGYSSQFVADVIGHLNLPAKSTILDPWNGSGTTTSKAFELGINSIGLDINPVMVIVARAKLLNIGIGKSLIPLSREILANASKTSNNDFETDPLRTWLSRQSAAVVRSIANSIATILTSAENSHHLYTDKTLADISDLAAFYLVALFRTVRDLLLSFESSNPTWIKTPTIRECTRPSRKRIYALFRAYVRNMAAAVAGDNKTAKADICIGNSSNLPAHIRNIDAIISSPPYCTRIDYAVATKPELAVLGLPLDSQFHSLRQKLIGSPVISGTLPRPLSSWGRACLKFANHVKLHPSKGSREYYYKFYLQYFAGLQKSLADFDRVLNPGGRCVLVLQDSYFKTERVDVAGYATEMAKHLNWQLQHRWDFHAKSLMSRINAGSKAYGVNRIATESVLWFSVT